MDIKWKCSKTQRPLKQKYATVWKNKIAQWEEPVSLKMIYTTLEWVVTTKHINWICETTSKQRNANRKKNFNGERNENNTNLWTESCKLANKKLLPRISLGIKGNYKYYHPNSKSYIFVFAWKSGKSTLSWRNTLKQILSSDLPVLPLK